MKPTRELKPLTRREIAAMWLYHREYAQSDLNTHDFYEQLSQSQKARVDEMIDDITKTPAPLKGN